MTAGFGAGDWVRIRPSVKNFVWGDSPRLFDAQRACRVLRVCETHGGYTIISPVKPGRDPNRRVFAWLAPGERAYAFDYDELQLVKAAGSVPAAPVIDGRYRFKTKALNLDEVAAQLTREQPLALISMSTTDCPNLARYAVVHHTVLRKAVDCALPLGALDWDEEAVEPHGVHQLGADETFADLRRMVRQVRSAPWPETHEEMTVTVRLER